MDHWREFQSSVDELNEFLKPSVLRRYQADLLNKGRFEVVSPLSGNTIGVNRSVLVGDHIAYLVDDETRLWILSGYIGLGYPLHHLFAESDGSNHPLIKHRKLRARGFRKKERKRLEAGFAAGNRDNDSGEIALVMGHVSFAHHLWNELSALNEWLRSTSGERLRNISLVKIGEPLGPLEKIFPRLAKTNLSCVEPEELEDALASQPLAVRLGSRLVTSGVRRKVGEFCERNADAFAAHPARMTMEGAWPRIWISVRLKSRTADNQEEFLLTLFRKTFETYPNAAILIDGFSFPFGFFDDPRTEKQREAFISWAGALDAFISELLRKAKETLGPAASRIASISGVGIADAIRFGADCDYYVCHIGTLQHKIAWLHNIPGIVHGPRPKERHATHFGSMVEDGIVPDVIPADLIVTSDSDRTNERNFNYVFADLEKSAQSVIDSMAQRLTQNGAPDREVR